MIMFKEIMWNTHNLHHPEITKHEVILNYGSPPRHGERTFYDDGSRNWTDASTRQRILRLLTVTGSEEEVRKDFSLNHRGKVGLMRV